MISVRLSRQSAIDFSACALEELNVIETTIRYLGGFLAAYDLSGGKHPILLSESK
jgi:mannosyl-oligosaccharide alpha-1,2-mannosidase